VAEKVAVAAIPVEMSRIAGVTPWRTLPGWVGGKQAGCGQADFLACD
jgi:hypothetical protein